MQQSLTRHAALQFVRLARDGGPEENIRCANALKPPGTCEFSQEVGLISRL